MRHVIAACAAVVALSSAARARDVRFGGAFQLNFAKLTGDVEGMGLDESRFGAAFGAIADIGMGDRLALRTGLFYTQKGGEGSRQVDVGPPFDTIAVDVEVKLAYLEIPVLVKVSFAEGRAYALGGLGIGINTGAELKASALTYSETFDVESDIEDLDLAVVIGAGAARKSATGTVTAQVQYSIGIKDVVEGEVGAAGIGTVAEARTRTFSVSVGYTF